MDRSGTRRAPTVIEDVVQSAEHELSLSRVEVRELFKCYGSIRAVNGISFEIQAGEIFGLLGPNGAGKTTTVESVVGLATPDSGEIEICGVDLRAHPRAAKQQLGVALQTTGLQDGITPREAIESFGALFHGAVAAEPLLIRFGLEAKADSRVSTLSSGQKQRLALALALVNDPRVIVLDEPTVGLDAQMRREFHEYIRAMRQDGRSILLTTHDMDEAAQLCDRVAVIDQGRIVATGSPSDLIALLQTAMCIELTADHAIDPAWLTPLTMFFDVRCHGTELSFTTAEPTAALARLLVVLAEHELKVVHLNAGKGTLEDAILEIFASKAST
jgi:ABC-2 type transport system ATP-binding protein